MLRLARALVRDGAQAEDVVQDVLVVALTRWERIERADDIDAYVRRMIVNRVNTWWRRPARREHARGPEQMPLRIVADQADGVVDRAALTSALADLSTKQRTVLVLRHYEGCADAQIAEVMGCPEATVRSHARRGLMALRAALDEDLEGEQP